MKKRGIARANLTALGTGTIHRVTATEIDRANLNELEEHAILSLVRRFEPDIVIIDALGHPSTIPATLQRLNRRLRKDGPSIQWIMEPKADATYPVVGAASIFAKLDRDTAIDELKSSFGDFGSGYPSDPKTKKWLADWHETTKPWPAFVRTRWGTVRNLGQRSLL